MSHHKVQVIKVEHMLPHGNADRLAVVPIWGYETIVAAEQWKVGDLGAYVEPDYEVPLDREEFAFLRRDGSSKEWHRVRAAKLRGRVSHGLLVKAPEGVGEGADVMAMLGVRRYEPPMQLTRGGDWSTTADGRPGRPGVICDIYDIESWHRYPDLIGPERLVTITEKIHGANFRAVAVKRFGREVDVWIGSRTRWVQDDGVNPWSRAWRGSEALRDIVLGNPNVVFFGEAFGPVQDLRYGRTDIDVLLFDALDLGEWSNGAFEAMVPPEMRPPVLLSGAPMPSRGALLPLAEGASLVAGADHIREGVVIRTVDDGPRVQLKLVGNGYLMR